MGRIILARELRARAAGVTPCLHCKGRPGDWRRGLCWKCFRTPEVRVRYPRNEKFASRVERHLGRRPPPRPTDAAPGTAAKVEVMAWRQSMGFFIFDARDARIAD